MKIIISLTSIPNRLLEPREHMGTRHALKTLLEQTYDDYEVHFNIPDQYKNTKIEIPSWLDEWEKKYPYLKIYRTEDFGSVTKILPTLLRKGDPEDIIITADDDLFYMDGIIPAHLEGRKKYPNCAIGFAGISEIGGKRQHFVTSVSEDCRVKILEGYKTVSYTRKFFDVEEFKNQFATKVWQDDHALSAYMGYRNIKKYVLTHPSINDFRPRVETFPCIKHVPNEKGGCDVFRKIQNEENDNHISEFYNLGYLER